MDITGLVTSLYFNTKEIDPNGNFIQPVMVVESEGNHFRLYLPKCKEEIAPCKKGDIITVLNVKESSGFLRADPDFITVTTADRRKTKAKSDSKQDSIWRGQAFNLAYNRAIEDNLFDAPPEILKSELFANAEQALQLIKEWNGESA